MDIISRSRLLALDIVASAQGARPTVELMSVIFTLLRNLLGGLLGRDGIAASLCSHPPTSSLLTSWLQDDHQEQVMGHTAWSSEAPVNGVAEGQDSTTNSSPGKGFQTWLPNGAFSFPLPSSSSCLSLLLLLRIVLISVLSPSSPFLSSSSDVALAGLGKL